MPLQSSVSCCHLSVSVVMARVGSVLDLNASITSDGTVAGCVLQFSPTTGPIKGKTSMSVSGLNLGKTYTDITGGITVAGINCEVKPDHYEPSSGWVQSGERLR